MLIRLLGQRIYSIHELLTTTSLRVTLYILLFTPDNHSFNKWKSQCEKVVEYIILYELDQNASDLQQY